MLPFKMPKLDFFLLILAFEMPKKKAFKMLRLWHFISKLVFKMPKIAFKFFEIDPTAGLTDC